MKEISVMISPTDNCNINCSYCYNLPRRIKHGRKVIERKAVEQTLRLVNEYVEAPMTQLVWHGGEPLLMGIEWFKDVQPLLFKYSTNTLWDQGIQTNATLLNEDWIRFIKDHNISISTSYDVFSQGLRERENIVWGNIVQMLKNGIRPGIITGVNSSNCTQMIQMYEFFKERYIGGFCFNPAYILEDAPPDAQRLKLDPHMYVREWERYLRHWLNDFSDRIIFERTIMEALAVVVSSLDQPCGTRDCQTEYLTVNCNGDITTCNRYCPDRYILGNIMDCSDISDVYESEGYKSYVQAIEERKARKCGDCSYLPYCRGGCKLNHMLKASGFDRDCCVSFTGTFDATYNLIRELRLEDPRINHVLFGLLASDEFFTVPEIKKFIYTIGYPGEIEYNGKDIPNCTEFRLFGVFNSRLSKRIIHQIPMRKYSGDMLRDEGYRQHRNSCMMSVYRDNARLIHEILDN